MKYNFSYPATGAQKMVAIADDKINRRFNDMRMSKVVDLDFMGDEFKGYTARLAGGNDKQGFPMKQGVLTTQRVRLLLSKGQSCYRKYGRAGERKRKSVRGCIYGPDICVINLVILRKGEAEIPGLTDHSVPRRLGPKRAANIRKLFNLSKEDDVRQYVVRRGSKAPKIQRLITPIKLQRKRARSAAKKKRLEKNKQDDAEYRKLLASRYKEERDMKQEAARRRRNSSSRSSMGDH